MKKLAVFFPGIGYHNDKPLLYYARKIAAEHGYTEQVLVTYSCEKDGLIGNDEKIAEAAKTLYNQAESILDGIQWDEYDDILFVSKSIGTAIAAMLEKKQEISCKNVYFTPIATTFENLKKENVDAIVFTGTKDPWVELPVVEKGCNVNDIPFTVIEGANHSLETENALENIKILQEVLTAVNTYLEK